MHGLKFVGTALDDLLYCFWSVLCCNGTKKLFYRRWGLCGIRPKWLWRGGWILWIFRGGELWYRGRQATGWLGWITRTSLDPGLHGSSPKYFVNSPGSMSVDLVMHESNQKEYDIVDQDRKPSTVLPDVRLIIWHFHISQLPALYNREWKWINPILRSWITPLMFPSHHCVFFLFWEGHEGSWKIILEFLCEITRLFLKFLENLAYFLRACRWKKPYYKSVRQWWGHRKGANKIGQIGHFRQDYRETG